MLPLLPVNKCKAALEHVVTMVFQLEPKNEIWKALVNDVRKEEQLDIYRLLRLDPDEIATLEYRLKDSSTTLVPLDKGLAVLITNFQEMYWEHKDADKDYEDDQILLIMADKFDTYQNLLHMK